jgi:hypothetical protein
MRNKGCLTARHSSSIENEKCRYMMNSTQVRDLMDTILDGDACAHIT